MTSRTSCARLAFIKSSSASAVIAWLCWLCLSVWRISSPMGVPPGSRSSADAMAERAQPLRQQFHLRGFAAAFRAFEGDEQAFAHNFFRC